MRYARAVCLIATWPLWISGGIWGIMIWGLCGILDLPLEVHAEYNVITGHFAWNREEFEPFIQWFRRQCETDGAL